MGRADQTTKVKGMFVHPGEVVEIGKRHPELGALRLVVRREGEQDAMTLRAETASPAKRSRNRVAATLQALTKLAATVEFVAAGLAAQRRQDDRRRTAGLTGELDLAAGLGDTGTTKRTPLGCAAPKIRRESSHGGFDAKRR